MSISSHAPEDRNWIGKVRSRLAVRRTEKPATKAGQIRAVWPEIEAALAVGQSMKTICAWIAEDAGITIGVTSLTSYVSRIRRREKLNRQQEVPSAEQIPPELRSSPPSRKMHPLSVLATAVKQPLPDDPLAQAMRVLSRPKMDIRKIHNDGDPEGRNLI